MIDKYGYPTEATLKILETCDCFPDTNREAFIDYIYENWKNGNGYAPQWNPGTRCLVLITGGWSGCESMIAALQRNVIFWGMFWEASSRGGKFVFRIPKEKKE